MFPCFIFSHYIVILGVNESECSKLFNYNLSGICRANTQMSPEQYATATSRIEERIQKPLLFFHVPMLAPWPNATRAHQMF